MKNNSVKIKKHKVTDCASEAACGLHCIKMNGISVRDGDLTIIENINLHIHCGKITVIIGKNGAGKSTLIKAILGEIKHEGTIEFTNLRNQMMENLSVGYVPQYINMEKNTPMSVYDLFAGYISNSPVFLRKNPKVYAKVKEQLSIFEAQDLIDKRACDLSGGELQRVLLSIAITPVPNLLLLDEPVSGIDKNGMQLFYKNIDMLRKNYDLAMIIVAHDFEFVQKYADYVILMDRKILVEGTPQEVLESEEFKRVFR
ncbi:metal ABC transporter ATP-binding protein [Mobilitalea sibirica]|uniref:Metal ABC transporter ATP-binding protein n=1 Tax=Mobilitalea sibirica TaxID=1462919 RepID=A0A8J7KVM3_9FIRM|nr:metal ABC transporter ATP-binding protein [Mobilitalea sibirica]MBH1940330.1 metal ABC transporter ATP-binding protein [Mobilitalea sibirica]